MNNKAIIVGATSGIGRQVTEILLQQGWTVGVCGRRLEKLEEIRQLYPEQVYVQVLDVTSSESPTLLAHLIEKMQGINLYFHGSGIGFQNKELEADKELKTIETNALGYARMVGQAFRYFSNHPEQNGHIACISSIAGVKGLGVAPAYSATKRFCNTYIEALEQQATIKGLSISFTDIRPGFVDTDLLKGDYKYPLVMKPEKVARAIVKAIEHRKRVAVIDWRYRLLVFFWRLIPSCIWVKMKIQ